MGVSCFLLACLLLLFFISADFGIKKNIKSLIIILFKNKAKQLASLSSSYQAAAHESALIQPYLVKSA